MTRLDRKCARWLFALALLTLAGLFGVKAVNSSNDMKKVITMTDRMKTVCVGRFLIDVPEQARVKVKLAWVDGLDIARRVESPDRFNAFLAKREADLDAKPNMLGRKNIESIREVRGEGFAGKVLVHSRYRTYGIEKEKRVYSESVAVEGYVHGNGMTYSFSAPVFDPAQTDSVPSLMGQLVGSAENEIPRAPGFCINGALIRDPHDKDRVESVSMFADIPGHPDLGMVFWTNTVGPDSAGLVERSNSALGRSPLMRARSQVLREGARPIGGLAGEEFVIKTTELNFATVFTLDWEMQGHEGDVFAPLVKLEMKTGISPRAGGKPVQSTLSEDAVLKLWDKVSSSIRLRPTAPDKVAEVAPPVTPLGTWAEAGERCPQSGWWLCADGGSGVGVLGGQRQYLRQGQKMPQALLLPPQTVWQKVRGLQPSYESRTRTGWKLVDKRLRDRTAPVVPLAQATLAAEVDAGNAIGSSFSTAQAAAPIGCCVKTGMQCPASGWWRCEESSALDGTRWFAAGSLLPAATFALPAGGFGRAVGKPEAIQRRSLWQLVRHASAPEEAAHPPGPDGIAGQGDAPAGA